MSKKFGVILCILLNIYCLLLYSVVCEVLYFRSCFAFVLLSFFVPFVSRNLCSGIFRINQNLCPYFRDIYIFSNGELTWFPIAGGQEV